jgi:hypothetical protein
MSDRANSAMLIVGALIWAAPLLYVLAVQPW